jgi:serine/threonine-protein kinase
MAEEIELYLDGEHDAMLRRELAARHAATARRYAEAEAGERTRASKGADAPVVSSRVAAMREAMKALALDADHVEAQKVLIDVLTSGSEAVPPAARTELEAVDERVRAGGVRVAMWGMVFWFAVVPLVLVAGVESWPMVIAPAALTVLAILFARHVLSLGRVTTGAALAMGGAAAFIMALVSCYMGPFALVPTGAVTSAMVFAMSASRRERPIGQAVFVLGALVPFLVEIAGIFPRAYSFDPGRIVVHARAIGLPQWPTMALMAASTIGWIIVSSVLVGRMRDALGAAEQRQFLQAWYLRQLFPDASERPDEPPPSAPASALPRRRWT